MRKSSLVMLIAFMSLASCSSPKLSSKNLETAKPNTKPEKPQTTNESNQPEGTPPMTPRPTKTTLRGVTCEEGEVLVNGECNKTTDKSEQRSPDVDDCPQGYFRPQRSDSRDTLINGKNNQCVPKGTIEGILRK